MTTIDPRTTLGELVTEHPDLSRFFDALGLDYCCGGGRTVEEACAAAGVDVEALERAVASTAADRDAGPAWTTMDPAELTVHIETTHHASLHRELPRLLALADKVVAVHGDRHPELAAARATLRELGDDLGSHLRQEEQVVFPMIRALSEGVSVPYLSVPCSIAA
jgi:regulator of cell morphogenesis and NO signaling